ncbi:CRISPR-associated endonuclease Cas3 [Sesbania bispinosa]|nr:CRISPR-associated endonuclease Cas3 [Sesbania bispinosa]
MQQTGTFGTNETQVVSTPTPRTLSTSIPENPMVVDDVQIPSQAPPQSVEAPTQDGPSAETEKSGVTLVEEKEILSDIGCIMIS